jgi:hypothetical protein
VESVKSVVFHKPQEAQQSVESVKSVILLLLSPYAPSLLQVFYIGHEWNRKRRIITI